MGYLLVDPLVLREKGINYFETIPDGRGIVDFGMIRVLGSVASVQVVGSKAELDRIINEQKEACLHDMPTVIPEYGDTIGSETITEDATASKEEPITNKKEGGNNGIKQG